MIEQLETMLLKPPILMETLILLLPLYLQISHSLHTDGFHHLQVYESAPGHGSLFSIPVHGSPAQWSNSGHFWKHHPILQVNFHSLFRLKAVIIALSISHPYVELLKRSDNSMRSVFNRSGFLNGQNNGTEGDALLTVKISAEY
jgi:hypothetical protein